MYFKFLLCSPNISVRKLPDDSMPATKKGCTCLSIYVCMCAKLLQSCRLFVTLWTVAHQTPLSMELSCPPPGDLSDPDIKLMSPVLADPFFTAGVSHGAPWATVHGVSKSRPGFSVDGILQARILELPFPFPGDLPDPGIEYIYKYLSLYTLDY